MTVEEIIFAALVAFYVFSLIFLNAKFNFAERRIPEKYNRLNRVVSSLMISGLLTLIGPILLFILILTLIWVIAPEKLNEIFPR